MRRKKIILSILFLFFILIFLPYCYSFSFKPCTPWVKHQNQLVESLDHEPLWRSSGAKISRSIKFSNDSKYIVTGSENHNVTLFINSSSTPLWNYTADWWVCTVDISADGQYIVAGSRGKSTTNKVYLFSKASPTPIWSKGSIGQIKSVAISADGEYIAAASSNSKLYLFHRSSSTPLWDYEAGYDMNSVSISSDGQYIVAGSNDDHIYFFNRTSNSTLWNYTTADWVNSVDISLDGQYVAAGGDDSNVYIFNKTGSKLQQYGVSGNVERVVISDNGQYIAASTDSNQLYLYIRTSPSSLWSEMAGSSWGAVSISADGQYIVSGGNDDRVYFFNRTSPTPLWTYYIGSPIRSVAISADGQYIVADGYNFLYYFHQSKVPEQPNPPNPLPIDLSILIPLLLMNPASNVATVIVFFIILSISSGFIACYYYRERILKWYNKSMGKEIPSKKRKFDDETNIELQIDKANKLSIEAYKNYENEAYDKAIRNWNSSIEILNKALGIPRTDTNSKKKIKEKVSKYKEQIRLVTVKKLNFEGQRSSNEAIKLFKDQKFEEAIYQWEQAISKWKLCLKDSKKLDLDEKFLSDLQANIPKAENNIKICNVKIPLNNAEEIINRGRGLAKEKQYSKAITALSQAVPKYDEAIDLANAYNFLDEVNSIESLKKEIVQEMGLYQTNFEKLLEIRGGEITVETTGQIYTIDLGITPKKVIKTEEAKVSILRGGEIIGDKYIFKIKVSNNSPSNINKIVATLVSFPKDCLKILTPEERRVDLIEIGGFRSLDYEFRPTKDCVQGNIMATVSYIDHQNNIRTFTMEPFIIRVICDLLKPQKITEEEFNNLILGFEQEGESVRISMDIKSVFEKAKDVLQSNNFHLIASKLSLRGKIEGMLKGFAIGLYTQKKIGIQINLSAPSKRDYTVVRVNALAEDRDMILPAVNEICDVFKRPKLLGKRKFYEDLGRTLIDLTETIQKDNIYLITLANLFSEFKKVSPSSKVSLDDIENALCLLEDKNLISGIKELESGIKIVEIQPLELSEDLNKVINLASEHGWVNREMLVNRFNWTPYACDNVLTSLEEKNFAKKIDSIVDGTRWYFPGIIKSEPPILLIGKLENALRNFIETNLSKISADWWNERIPQNILDIFTDIKKRRERLEAQLPWRTTEPTKDIELLNFVDYQNIILYKKNWKDIFSEFFKDKQFLIQTFKEISYYRNELAHSRKLSEDDDKIFRASVQKVLHCIK